MSPLSHGDQNDRYAEHLAQAAALLAAYDDDYYSDSDDDSDYDDESCMGEGGPETALSYPDSDSYADYDNATRVRFSVAVKRFDTIPRTEYTDEETRMAWWSPEERKKRAEKRMKTMKRMETGKPPKKDSSYRGLDVWTEDGGNRLSVIVALCVDAVMDEQEAQWDRDRDDPEKIAAASKRLSIRSTGMALNRALEDRKEAVDAWLAVDDQGKQIEFITKSSRRRKKSKGQKTHQKYPRRGSIEPPGKVTRQASRSSSNDFLKDMQSAAKTTKPQDEKKNKTKSERTEKNKSKPKESQPKSRQERRDSIGQTKAKTDKKKKGSKKVSSSKEETAEILKAKLQKEMKIKNSTSHRSASPKPRRDLAKVRT